MMTSDEIGSKENVAVLSSENQLVQQDKWMTHDPKAGLNPLVDSAAYLFSLIGQLKNLKSYHQLDQLQKTLIGEINRFQEAAKAQGYRSEYIVVSRYALCATFDDIIANTAWGGQGQWEHYRLLNAFNSEVGQQERFFLIIDRIIKEPALYIDVMELMYLCLSLGYKGNYRSTEWSQHQLEKITHGLYKRICAYRGHSSRMLSPFPLKTGLSRKITKKPSYWLVLFITASIVSLLFVGLGFLLNTLSDQTYQALTQIGKLAV
jgi:type VI secretion system protein ImpK